MNHSKRIHTKRYFMSIELLVHSKAYGKHCIIYAVNSNLSQ